MNADDAEKFAECFLRWNAQGESMAEYWRLLAKDLDSEPRLAATAESYRNHARHLLRLLDLEWSLEDFQRSLKVNVPSKDRAAEIREEAIWSTNLEQLRDVWRRAADSDQLTEALRAQIEAIATEFQRLEQAAA